MLDDEQFRALLEYLNRPWAGFRKVRKGVKKRIRKHMQDLGCPTIDQYLHVIATQPEALDACNRHLRVTISRFFRDRRLWAYLRDCLLPGLIASLHEPLRAWSAGCASGEEAYSLAIVWEQQNTEHPLIVTATDASRKCLARAHAATYGRSSLKELSNDLRTNYFKPTSSGSQYTLRSFKKSALHWQHHDLLEDPMQGPFQLIFLRNNLLTYYQGRSQQVAFNRIANRLAPGGYLIIGSHERLPPNEFQLIRDETCQWIYQRVGLHAPHELPGEV